MTGLCREQVSVLQGKAFAATGHVMRALEAVAVAAAQQEPMLLVGETGTGKTTLVQHVAEQVGLSIPRAQMKGLLECDFTGALQHPCSRPVPKREPKLYQQWGLGCKGS